MKKLRWVIPVVLVLLAAAGYYVWSKLPRFPDRPFAALPGPYQVGTREYSWVDSSRGEPYTKDPGDKRHVVAQIWYPANAPAGVEPALYLQRPAEFADSAGADKAKKVRANAFLDVPVAKGDSAFPVLLYNHGGGWTRWSATFATEWLASRGYVVISVEHFGFNQTVRYPDGSPFKADTLEFPKPSGDDEKDALGSWAFLEDPVFLIWKADARFALDRLAELNRDPGPFQGRLDLDRIGAFGWSFGGALAVQLAAEDPRVKAAVDHDGQLFGDVRRTGTTRPVMLIHHGADDAEEYPKDKQALVHKMMALTASWDTTARRASTGDWYDVDVARTDHGDFSDLALFYPRAKGRLAAKRGHEIIDAYTGAFFDRYLRGRPSELLTAPNSPFPEATFHPWPKP